jgi:hypothetical protein
LTPARGVARRKEPEEHGQKEARAPVIVIEGGLLVIERDLS